ncbi:MAG: hypothetical protein ACI9LO_001282 [Planctomycetota bacterium]
MVAIDFYQLPGQHFAQLRQAITQLTAQDLVAVDKYLYQNRVEYRRRLKTKAANLLNNAN